MDSASDGFVRKYKWHIVIICAALAVVVVLMFTTDLFEPSETSLLRQMILMLGALSIMPITLSGSKWGGPSIAGERDSVTRRLKRLASGLWSRTRTADTRRRQDMMKPFALKQPFGN